MPLLSGQSQFYAYARCEAVAGVRAWSEPGAATARELSHVQPRTVTTALRQHRHVWWTEHPVRPCVGGGRHHASTGRRAPAHRVGL